MEKKLWTSGKGGKWQKDKKNLKMREKRAKVTNEIITTWKKKVFRGGWVPWLGGQWQKGKKNLKVWVKEQRLQKSH